MTKQQISWAMSHDWFIGVVGEDAVLVLDVSFDRLGVKHTTTRVYRNYRALRNWAGY